ncbi:hypothetical protein CORC01_06361 [Colletotrichum orchidophilum]|uniref:Uncharacterized protein n=1 Tax=Colletotrichum orchidophilum TaxID=1209926 RepID=A0A1G4BAK6_9PEZI|nr:uncharacterized protein CORC01_06361 [Colletotrichum orchidophilum]OHE98365.1 hypothetical protein CORC01_06361 [Colletotrichum orchidophilum]
MAVASLGLSCPKGGDFYICEGSTVEFLGCCATNPCADGSGKCPTKDRRISAFNPDRYANIPAQGCDDARPASEIFWTCTNDISFIGCCATNPCREPDGLCPATNLISATLSSNASSRAVFVPDESVTPTQSASPTPTAAPTGSSPGEGGGGGLGTGAVVGIAIGAAVAVGIIVAMIWRCGWHARKRNERREPPAWEASQAAQAAVQSPHPSQHPEMGYSTNSPNPYDSAHASYVTTAVPSSYAPLSSPNSPYYPTKHPGSPMSIDPRHVSTYSDSNVSSLSGRNMGVRHLPSYPAIRGDLQPVSELDSTEREVPRAELGDGAPMDAK